MATINENNAYFWSRFYKWNDLTMAYTSTNYSFISRYIRHVTSSAVLIFFTILALIFANLDSTGAWYFNLWNSPVAFSVGDFNFFSHGGHALTLGEFVNDFLMAIFFLSVGLEIKREIRVGELSTKEKAMLPIIGACGGMLVPVLIFALVCPADEILQRGLAIPMATDIAFSLGVLSIFSRRVPLGLKIFLAALAVADDLGGIIVIALFYSSDINFIFLVLSALCIGAMVLANMLKVRSTAFYVIVGLVLWFMMLNSGIHSTIAGVAVAFCVPATLSNGSRYYLHRIKAHVARFPEIDIDDKDNTIVWTNEEIHVLKSIESAADKMISPLQYLEDSLHFPINYIVIPLFAFANAGVCFEGMSLGSVFSGVGLAVMLGLVLGKFIGVFSFSWLAVRLNIVRLPEKATWKSFAGVCMLCGIGFTVSMFIADLSYSGVADGAAVLDQAKLGILISSVIAAVIGCVMLNKTLPPAQGK